MTKEIKLTVISIILAVTIAYLFIDNVYEDFLISEAESRMRTKPSEEDKEKQIYLESVILKAEYKSTQGGWAVEIVLDNLNFNRNRFKAAKVYVDLLNEDGNKLATLDYHIERPLKDQAITRISERDYDFKRPSGWKGKLRANLVSISKHDVK